MTERFEALYLIVFVSTAALLFALERLGSLQRRAVPLGWRSASNIGLFLAGNLFAALLLPVGIVAFASNLPPGLVSGSPLSAPAQGLLSFVLLDLWRYAEHRLFHHVPLLWRLHRVHHSDVEIDVTTSERHHPFDVLLGSVTFMVVVAALGIPAFAVGIYVTVAVAVSLVSHANLRLPERIDRRLRRVVVTPAFHAAHHSAWRAQTDSHYGAVLTLWDRLFGSAGEPANAPPARIGLEDFRGAADAGFLRLLRQPFLDPRAPAKSAPVEQLEPLSPAWRRCVAFAVIGVGAVSLAMWPAWVELAAAWRSSEAFHWGWFVVPLVIYLLFWHRRAALRGIEPRPGLAGVLTCIAATVLWWAAELMNVNVGRQLALVIALQGIALSALGWRAYRQLFPTLALLFLMIPSADLLQPALRAITARSIELFAVAAGLPHHVDGFVILIGARRYVVVDECSGLAYVTLALFLGYAFGLLLYRAAWKAAALAVCAGALGVLCNVIRVNTIVAIDWIRGSQMDLAAHGEMQWLALLVLLGLLLYGLARLPAEAAARPQSMPASAPSGRWFGPVLAAASVLLVVAGGNELLEPSLALASPSVLPGAVAGWSRDSDGAAWTSAPDGLSRSFELRLRRGERHVQVRVVEAVTIGAKLPALRAASAGSGGPWREVRTEPRRDCASGRCIAFAQQSFQGRTAKQRRSVYAAYGAGELITDSTLAFRATHARQRLAGQPEARRSIALTVDGEELAVSDAARLLRELQAAMEGGAASSSMRASRAP